MRVFAFKNMKATKSSSGGAFPSIASVVAGLNNSELYVYGAAFNNMFQVEHICKPYSMGIDELSESKYVRSLSGPAMQDAISRLTKGQRVLFTGTPCQIYALKELVKKKSIDDKYLYTVDLICHGTPKNCIWKAYLKYAQERHTIENVSFRHRSNIKKFDGIPLVKYKGIKKEEYNPKWLVHYMRLFSENLSLDAACFKCQHRNKDLVRPGDLTIGDFWGINEIVRDFRGKGHVSLILSNTSKGEKILKDIRNNAEVDSDILREIKTEQYLIFNPHLNIQTKKPNGYDMFWKDYESLSFEEFYDKYSKVSIKKNLKSNMSKISDRLGLKYKLKYIKYKLHR